MTSQTNPAFRWRSFSLRLKPLLSGEFTVNTIFAIQALLRATADAARFRRSCSLPWPRSGKPLPTQASRGVADAAPSSPAPAAAAAGAPPNTFRTTAPWVVGFLYLVVPAEHLTAIAEQPQSVSEEEAPLWYCITKGKYVGVTLNHPLALAAHRRGLWLPYEELQISGSRSPSLQRSARLPHGDRRRLISMSSSVSEIQR
ncbi:hypothetical protein R3P38DRAFT_2814966 [Favolaschia claudopus]|uniref:Uncharacterized protein n=1 Tax=Favolaschia claudopus TaxID=2862362 RepID=A0AAV9Z2C7_9AGAR